MTTTVLPPLVPQIAPAGEPAPDEQPKRKRRGFQATDEWEQTTTERDWERRQVRLANVLKNERAIIGPEPDPICAYLFQLMRQVKIKTRQLSDGRWLHTYAFPMT